jgi:chromosome segregation ATPase
MKIFISELTYLTELYDRLDHEYLHLNAGVEPGKALSQHSIALPNAELLSRIEQMNGRLQQLAEEWEKFRDQIDPAARETIRSLAASARSTAGLLAERCRLRSEDLETGREHLQKEMESLQKGARYLQTMTYFKGNYPKFIDSRS